MHSTRTPQSTLDVVSVMFQPEVESMAVKERAALQRTRLRELVARLRASESTFCSDKLARIDEDAELPFTTKADLLAQYPYGSLVVLLEETVRVHASSGTRHKPTIVAYTARDVEVFAEVNARAIACAGGRPEDVLHVAYGYGLFTGGLGLHYGGERLG